MRVWIANHLRELADRLDWRGAARVTGWSFTFEEGEGIRFRQDGRGCPVAYVGDEQYDRAHSESDSARADAEAFVRMAQEARVSTVEMFAKIRPGDTGA